MAAGQSDIPLEAILKLAVDRAGGDEVKTVLEGYSTQLREGEDSVRRTGDMLKDMVGHVSQIGDGLKGMGGLLGIAGAGAVAQQFMAASGAGAGVAMAEGHLTGSNSTYGSYAQSLLGVQAATGVAYAQLEEGLRTVAQMAGGNLSPSGAARFGALIAGASLAAGMSPQGISSILGSFMESTGMTEGYGTGQGVQANTGLMAGVTQALSAFQGTQVGGMLPTVASVYEQQALRSGPGGPSEGPAQTAGFMNALAQANPLFRNAKTTEAAIEGGNAYLLSGLTNPMVRFAEARAGVGINEAMEGGPEALEKMAFGLREQLPGATFREALRSQFPAATAKMMEEVVGHPGLMREDHRKALEAAVNPNVAGYENTIQHSLASQTPEKELSKFAAQLLSAVMPTLSGVNNAIGPIGTMAGILGVGSVAGSIANGAAGMVGDAGKGILGTLGVGGLEAGALTAGDLLAGVTTGGLSVAAQALIFPEATGLSHGQAKNAAEATRYLTVEEAMAKAKQKYGGSWLGHEKEMEEYVRRFGSLKPGAEGPAPSGHSDPQAQHILHEALGVAKVPSVVKELEAKFGENWYGVHHGTDQKKIEGFVGERLKGAGRQTLDEEVGQLRKYQELGPEGYWQGKFGESVGKFTEAVQHFLHGDSSHKNTGYEGGATSRYAGYSPTSAALATNPGMVYAAWLHGGGSASTGGAHASPASLLSTTSALHGAAVSSGVAKWEALMAEASSAHPHVPTALLAAVMTKESGGNASAVSSAGAEGLMQLMPGTAAGLGVRNPLNARENVFGGAKLLEQLLGQYHGNLHSALEAYNAGPGNLSAGAGYATEVEGILRKIDRSMKQLNSHMKRVKAMSS